MYEQHTHSSLAKRHVHGSVTPVHVGLKHCCVEAEKREDHYLNPVNKRSSVHSPVYRHYMHSSLAKRHCHGSETPAHMGLKHWSVEAERKDI